MKKFSFGIFVWFLIQLVMISAFGNMFAAQDYASGITPRSCEDVNGAWGFVSGLIFPIVETPLVTGDWCWNQ